MRSLRILTPSLRPHWLRLGSNQSEFSKPGGGDAVTLFPRHLPLALPALRDKIMPKTRPSKLPWSRLPFHPRAVLPTPAPAWCGGHAEPPSAPLNPGGISRCRRPGLLLGGSRAFTAALVTRLQRLVDSLGPPRPSAGPASSPLASSATVRRAPRKSGA